jgi:hypothetical protein
VYLLDELAGLARLPADHLAWLRALGQRGKGAGWKPDGAVLAFDVPA